ncbi:MAG: PQQ-binding-like beta-propeller repeat protein [Armatimonadetes bacterium]|nr:PQQ-binding-like beta-propeller repeat protein [Armatimonadota bacterium]
MRRSILLIILATLFLSPFSILAADWPFYRGLGANGMSSEKVTNKNWNQSKPGILWKVAMGDDGYAGPSVAGGKVFIVDHKGKNDIVRAIDINTGKDVWRYTYEDAEKSNYGFTRCTPVVDRGRVYTISRLGTVNCLDVKSGKKIWSRNICKDFNGVRPQWDYSMSALIDGNRLIVMPGGPDASVAALDKTTGKTLWRGGGSDLPGYATPVLATIEGKRQYIAFMGTSIFSVDAANGALLWSYPWKSGYDINAAQPIVLGNNVFASSAYGHGCALLDVSGNQARAVWENKELAARFSSPILYQGNVYGTEDPGNFVCLDPRTGKVNWKQPGFEWGGLIGIDGTALVFDGKSGDLVMVKLTPEKYQELGRFTPLGGQSWTAPIVSNGKLIVRNKTALACFNLK